jgi:hypothetical protein
MQLTKQDVAPAKLVDPANLPPLNEVQIMLEHAFVQGSQTWGVKREIGIILVLAQELLEALDIAQAADANQRMLKGAQLETGRLRKQVSTLRAELDRKKEAC